MIGAFKGMTEKIDIFLSYARGDDEPFVLELYEYLTARGFKVWWDKVSLSVQHIIFFHEIKRAIEACDCLIAVMGPKAVESYYVRAEWQHALFLTKEVLPILRLENFELVPQPLKNLQCLDCRNYRHYSEALSDLCQILTKPFL
jgi:hypothetical protein